MTILAMRLSKFPQGIRILYKKNDKLFIRTGADGFTIGKPLQTTVEGACSKWGFHKVTNPPTFKSNEEVISNIYNFQMSPKGTITYYPTPSLK